jgi:hypothetical protein
MAANEAYRLYGQYVAGFLAVTSGTLTIIDASGLIVVNAVPVTAGSFTPLPFMFQGAEGAIVQLAGGASGTLAT